MSVIEIIKSKHSVEKDALSAFTAEAWMDPSLVQSFASDRHRAIRAFARKHALPVPSADEIEHYVLPGNPAGELVVALSRVTMDTTTDGCNTSAPGCGSNNGTCGPTPTTTGLCPSTACSHDCAFTYNDQCFG
jgi:hypothetical protein